MLRCPNPRAAISLTPISPRIRYTIYYCTFELEDLPGISLTNVCLICFFGLFFYYIFFFMYILFIFHLFFKNYNDNTKNESTFFFSASFYADFYFKLPVTQTHK